VSDYLDYSLVEEDLGDVIISYSPSTIFSNAITYDIVNGAESGRKVSLSWISKYVGEQYLDNTETPGRTIDSFFTNDMALNVEWKAFGTKRIMFNFLLRNVLDEEYASNGWTYRYLYGGQETSFDALFPQAGRNFMAGLRVEF
jgi:iron complex outermembrane receptor protein